MAGVPPAVSDRWLWIAIVFAVLVVFFMYWNPAR
jgi:hypothetical protein